MNKTSLNILRNAIFLAFGILLLYLAFRDVRFNEMISILKGAKYSWVALSLILSIFAFASRARRWSLLIEPLSHRPGLWNTYNAVLFGYLANYALPRMGEITRCIALSKKEKIPVESLIGTVVVERAIDMLSLLLIIVLLLIARFKKFGEFFQDQIFQNLSEKTTGIMGGSALFWIALITLTIATPLLLYLFRKQLLKLKVIKWIAGFIRRLSEGMKSVSRMKRKWEFIFHTLFIWSNYALMTWVVVFALPEITGDLKFTDGVFLLVIGSLGMVAPVQAGIGAFHWIVSTGLQEVYNVGETESMAFASLQHTSQTLLVFLLGSIAALFLFTKIGDRKQLISNEKEETDPQSEN